MSLKDENTQLQANNLDMKQKIKDKEIFTQTRSLCPINEYSLVMNQVGLLESYGGTNMNVQIRRGQGYAGYFQPIMKIQNIKVSGV